MPRKSWRKSNAPIINDLVSCPGCSSIFSKSGLTNHKKSCKHYQVRINQKCDYLVPFHSSNADNIGTLNNVISTIPDSSIHGKFHYTQDCNQINEMENADDHKEGNCVFFHGVDERHDETFKQTCTSTSSNLDNRSTPLFPQILGHKWSSISRRWGLGDKHSVYPPP
jgi:hypothetical protein